MPQLPSPIPVPVLLRTNNDAGKYEVFGLRPGAYKVVVNRAGFGSEQIDNVIVVRVNATLRVSSAEEKIEVTVGVPEISTENATIRRSPNA